MSQSKGIVYLIGAGPGEPGLVTLHGRDLIAAADLVIYADSLVDAALEAGAPDNVTAVVAEVIDAARAEGRIFDIGLRLNPLHPEGEVPKYDPSQPHSRLGFPVDQLRALYRDYPRPEDSIADFNVRLFAARPWRRFVRPSVMIGGDFTILRKNAGQGVPDRRRSAGLDRCGARGA